MSLHTEFQPPVKFWTCDIYILPTEHKNLLDMTQNHSSVTLFLNFIY